MGKEIGEYHTSSELLNLLKDLGVDFVYFRDLFKVRLFITIKEVEMNGLVNLYAFTTQGVYKAYKGKLVKEVCDECYRRDRKLP
jgi:hypothetical protein